MRVAVAMSGGVDSSVAALLLKEQGNEVVGLSMQLYDHSSDSGRTGRCCTSEDLADARRVAWALDVPHYVVNLEEEFRDEVVRPFVASYLEGETPIPCSACNSRVKFATLWERARAMGCDAVATGHYARVETDPVTRVPTLKKGLDSDKDQSYFLYDLSREQLAAAAFPVGGLTKGEVRAHARRARLPTADKEESQEICFVAKGTRAGAFVASAAPGLGLALPTLPGSVENARGDRLGEHDGHFRFTVGQRRGLNVSSAERLYVLSIDPAANKVVVGGASDLDSTVIEVSDLRFPSGIPPVGAFRAGVRIRHRAPEVPATVSPRGEGSARVVFDRPVRAAAPGQSCVFYREDVVLGGGVIRRREGREGLRS